MDLSILKLKISQVPGNERGRRCFPIELQREVVEAAKSSGLDRKQFLSEIGLNPGQFYVMRSTVRDQSTFREIKVTREEGIGIWEITGPGGLKMTCQSVEDVVKLWRALC